MVEAETLSSPGVGYQGNEHVQQALGHLFDPQRFDLGRGEMKRLGLNNKAVEEPSALQGMQRSPVPPEAPAASSCPQTQVLRSYSSRLESKP